MFDSNDPINDGGDEGTQTGPAVWGLVHKQLQSRVRDADDLRWIGDLRLVAEVDGELMLAAADQLAFDRVTGRLERTIKTAWKALDPAGRKIRLICWRTLPADVRGLVSDPWAAAEQIEEPEPEKPEAPETGSPQMTFDTLVAGPSNEIAIGLARRLASGQPIGTSTILVYGPQGTGKTHMMHALRTEAALLSPARKIVYLTAEEFMSAYHEGVRARDTSALKKRLRSASVLLIDDLHRIAGKPGTETELYQNIREVTSNGGHVLLVGDQAPSDVVGFGPRMRAEIKGAIAIEIGLPDTDMRREILERLSRHIVAMHPQFVLTSEMIARLNSAIRGPGRELTGAVWSLFTETGFGERPPTPEMIERIIRRHEGEAREPTIEAIKRAAIREFAISKADMEGPSKAHALVYPRHIAMYLCRQMTRKSLPQIGRAFKRDHTTVIHCLRTMRARLKTDDQLVRDVARLEEAVIDIMSTNPN